MPCFNRSACKRRKSQRNVNTLSQICLFALLSSAFALSAIASPEDNIVKVRFTTDDRTMIFVPVSINGAGPFTFLLDTGDTTTIIDRKLADQLSLPLMGKKQVTGISAQMQVSIAHSTSITIAGRTVHNLNVDVMPNSQTLPSDVRGVLGEDFLGFFDLLIDNRHHVLQMQLGPGPMSEMFDGEHLPVSLKGIVDGELINHRLIVTGYSVELTNPDLSLQLDSGANSLYIFGGPESLGVGATAQRSVATTISNSQYQFLGYKKKVLQLSLGQKKLVNVMALSLPRIPGLDTDGLMPTSAFDSIFISHSQKFLILDPTTKRMPMTICSNTSPTSEPNIVKAADESSDIP
jgi:predicted aspartyl protease